MLTFRSPDLISLQTDEQSKYPRDSSMSVHRPVAAVLSELLESSLNLPDATCEVGRVNLGPAELQKQFKARAASAGPVDARAHYLLAGSGFNAENIISDIATIRLDRAQNQFTAPGVPQLGVEGYLSSKKQDSVFASIDAMVENSSREFEAFLSHNFPLDWKTQKQQVYQALGLVSSRQAGLPLGSQIPNGNAELDLKALEWRKQRLGISILGSTPLKLVDPTVLHKASEFGRVVSELIDAFSAGRKLPIADKFREVAAQFDPGASPQINEIWNVISLLAGPNTAVGELAEGYRESKRVSTLPTPGGIKSLQLVANRSRQYLEEQYRQHIDGEIENRRKEAKIGGTPVSFKKIEAFVKLTLQSNGQWDQRLELVNEIPIWAYLYYLLRAGYLDEAVRVVKERDDIFGYVQKDFAVYLQAYAASPERVLPQNLEEQIQNEYLDQFRAGAVFDPFKQALYKIIGRCDLQHRSLPLVAPTTEDWLWLQLVLIRDGTSDANLSTNQYRLSDLQELVLKLGAKSFDPSELNPGKYFAVLMLTGLYERAVSYLYRFNEVYAVHYAIALAVYGLVVPLQDVKEAIKREEGVSSSGTGANGQLLEAAHESSEGFVTLDLVWLLGRYTRLFRTSATDHAANYLLLIAAVNPGQKAFQTYAQESLQELALETRKYQELLGDISVSSSGNQGLLEKRMGLLGINDRETYRHKMAHECAVKADDDGKQLDAILLYYLAEEFDQMLGMVDHELGDVIASATLGQPLNSYGSEFPTEGFLSAEDPALLATNALSILGNFGLLSSVAPDLVTTAKTLLSIASAINLLAQQDYEKCLETIDKTGLLPMGAQASVGSIRDMAQQFSHYHESLARNIPVVLELTLLCCSALIKQLRQISGPSAPELIERYSQRATNCMVYAGLIQTRMPRHVFSRLTQLEAAL